MCAGAFGIFIKLMGDLDACRHNDSTDMIPGSVGMTDVTLPGPQRQGSLSQGSGDPSERSVTLVSAHPPPAAIDLLYPS